MKRIIFHHLPKSGGTSVNHAILGLIEGREYLRIGFGNPNVNTRETLEKTDPRFVSSHYAFFADRFEKEDGEFFFTWLRDPVDMFWSGCEYYRMAGKPDRGFQPDNVMQELIDGLRPCLRIRDYVDMVLRGDRKREDVFPVRWFQEDWSRFDFIGFTERFGHDIGKLGKALGMELPVIMMNRTKSFKTGRRFEDQHVDRKYRRNELLNYFEPEYKKYAIAKAVAGQKWTTQQH